MSKDDENVSLADEIIAFFKTTFNEEVSICQSENGDGFEIVNRYDFTFDLEHTGATPSEVAWKYFESRRFHYRFVVENKRSGSWLDGGHKYSKKEKERAQHCLAKFDAWAVEKGRP